MPHQMKNIFVFSVFHCVEGELDVTCRGTRKSQTEAPREELKNDRGRGWAVPYKIQTIYQEKSDSGKQDHPNFGKEKAPRIWAEIWLPTNSWSHSKNCSENWVFV